MNSSYELNRWPREQQVFNNRRIEFVEDFKGVNQRFMENNRGMFDINGKLTDTEADVCAEAASDFMFGTIFVQSKFYKRDCTANLIWGTTIAKTPQDVSYRIALYVAPDGKRSYIINAQWFTYFIKEYGFDKDKSNSARITASGIEYNNINDMMFFIGVEEGAHELFHLYEHENKIYLPKEIKTTEYLASDIEYKATIWKLGIARRYFATTYYPKLSTLYSLLRLRRQNQISDEEFEKFYQEYFK